MTLHEAEIECPIDGKKFKQVLAASGTQFGQMLDLKPYGPIAAPWPLPVCPGNGFVVYRNFFKPEEINLFRAYVATPEYAALRTETPYYRVARLMTHVGEKRDVIAFTLLQATWEAEPAEKYARYAREALETFREVLAGAAQDKEKWPNSQMVAGELERRLGLFEDARDRFSRLKQADPFKSGILAEIADLQLQLIAQKDSRPHQIPQRKR